MDAQQAAIQQANILARGERREILRQEAAKIERCDGADPGLVRRWIKEVQLSLPHLDNPMRIELIALTTYGPLRMELEAFLDTQQIREDTPWPEIRTHVLHTFVSADHAEYQRTLLAQVRQKPGENILRYNMRFRDAATEAFPGQRTPDQNRELVRLYGAGLHNDADAQRLVRDGWPVTVELAFTTMANRETGVERYAHLGRREERMDVDSIRPKQEASKDPQLEVIISKLAALEAANKVSQRAEKRRTHDRVPKTEQPREDRRPHQRTRECYTCGHVGHFARNCPQSRGRGHTSGGRTGSQPTASKN